MRRLILILALMVLNAHALAGYCAKPRMFEVPSGDELTSEQIMELNDSLHRYMERAKEYQECVLETARESHAEAETMKSRFNRSVREYNAAAKKHERFIIEFKEKQKR